jgi:hypothetical protein
MKGTGVPLDVMDFLYNELYFGVIEKRSCPYAPFVMKLICNTWLKTLKTNLGATEHLNLMFHEVKRIQIMAHLPPRRLEMQPLRATVLMRICDDLKFDNKFEVPVMYSTAIPEPLLRYT